MLEDSSNMAFSKFNLRGNHKQETREGYNLLDTTEFEDNTSDGVSLVVNEDGTLELNGTATADTTFRILKTEKSITATGNENIVINKLNGTLEGTVRLICQDNDYGNTVYSQIGTSEFTNKLTADITYNIFSLQVYNGAVCNNLKLGLVISSSKTAYEQYGATPSVEIPSEIETTGEDGSIDETVCNKNFLPMRETEETTINGITYSIENGVLKVNGTSTAGFAIPLFLKDTILKKGKTYTISVNRTNQNIGNSCAFAFRDVNNTQIFYLEGWSNKSITKEITEDTIISSDNSKTNLWINSGYKFNNTEYRLQLEERNTATDYVAHEEQNIAMPCQQPMVDVEDYIDWDNEEEVHGYKTVVLTGQEEGWNIVTSESGDGNTKIFRNRTLMTGCRPNEGIKEITSRVYCTHFKNITGTEIRNISNIGITVWDDTSGPWIRAPYTTVEEWKAWLAEQVEAGTPVEIRYPLATPTRLPFTPAQKAVKEQIKALHTYKNVTNIYSTDEVGANVEATYYKDLETIINSNNNNLQQQINNITELLNTTETSAMLLDNLETDLVEEVE